jgi:hypothetical protein
MTTIEELELQVDGIVNRYKDIDKERKEKEDQYKKRFNNISIYATEIALVIVVSFVFGLLSGIGLHL